jgi:hypothetical protein
MQEDADQETNPYLALRASKIARNQARLAELGLLPVPSGFTRRDHSSSNERSSAVARRVSPSQPHKRTPSPVVLRRSNRHSGQTRQANNVEASIRERRLSEGRKRSRPEHVDKDHDVDDLQESQGKRLPSLAAPPPRAPPSPRSVRMIALDPNVIVENFLGSPMERTGKEFVIHESFRLAASQDDKNRLGVDPALSFNKYSGIQEWKNVSFLWVNLVASERREGTVRTANTFMHGGRLVTWFGGSRMSEDSPVIQSLVKMGMEAIANTSSAIVLWCRLPLKSGNASSMGPYVCLGRLAYDSHCLGSHPVAFTWRLIDYEKLAGPSVSSETRERFLQIVGASE